MEVDLSLREQVVQLFDKSQEVTFDISAGIEILRNILAKTSNSKFDKGKDQLEILNTFYECLYILLPKQNSHENRVHFVMQFVISVLADFNQNEDEMFIQFELISFLIRNLKAKSDIVRQRICYIIYNLLSTLNDTPAYVKTNYLDQRLIFKLQLKLNERQRDVNKKTQILAIKAAAFLQMPSNRYCPVINSFLDLLKHESLVEIKLLIIESIAITVETFDIFKECLMYDACLSVRDKAMEMLEKKVTKKYFDAELKQHIVNTLWRNENFELLEKFVYKWSYKMNACSFLKSLNINDQYMNCGQLRVDLLDEKIYKVMSIFFSQNKIFTVIIDFNKSFATEDIFIDLELAIHLRFILKFALENNLTKILSQHLIVDPEHFLQELTNKLTATNTNEFDSFVLFNLIEAFIGLCKLNLCDVNEHILGPLIYAVDSNYENLLLIVDSLISKVDPTCRQKIVWNLYKRFQLIVDKDLEDLSKFMTILSCFIARLSENDYNDLAFIRMQNLNKSLSSSEIDEFTASNENVIDYLVLKIAIENLSHLNPRIRALSVQILGLVSSISKRFAENYITLLLQILVVDFSDVVLEAQKALYNILLHYSNKNCFDQTTWEKCISTLEEQFDILNNPEIKFTAYEGFTKLLLNNATIPKKRLILIKLITAYFANPVKTDSQMNENQIQSDKKLKSCLIAFFHAYTGESVSNRDEFSKLAMPVFKLAIEEYHRERVNLRKLASFFYFFTQNTQNKRQLILKSILNEISMHINDYKRIVKWIEVILEFNLHECDLDEETDRSVNVLLEIYGDLMDLLEKFKKEKWRMTRENDLRNLMNSIYSLILKSNGGRLIRKHKLSDVESENDNDLNRKERKIEIREI